MSAEVPGTRISDLRRLLSLSQAELADLSGVPQPNLSAIEKGRKSLTTGVIVRVCKATATPVEFFDVASAPYDSTAIHFRKSSRVSARGRDFVLQAFKEIERVSTRLAQSPVRLRYNALPIAETADIVSDSDIEAFCAEVRQASGLAEADSVRNVIRTAERAGMAVAPLSVPLGTDNEALLGGHCGMSRWGNSEDRPTIAYITGLPGDRLRFTIAHEIAHTLLHTRRTVADEKEREREADLFAGAFLMHEIVARESISETMTLHGFMRLKAQFGMSIQAIIARARKLGLISQQRQRSLMIQISSRGWRTSEPVSVSCENPMLLWTQLAGIYGPSPYFAASKACGVSPMLLEQWIPARPVRSQRVSQESKSTGAVVGDLEARRRRRDGIGNPDDEFSV